LSKNANLAYNLAGGKRETGQRRMLHGRYRLEMFNFYEKGWKGVERGGKERENESLVRRTRRESAHKPYGEVHPEEEVEEEEVAKAAASRSSPTSITMSHQTMDQFFTTTARDAIRCIRVPAANRELYRGLSLNDPHLNPEFENACRQNDPSV